MSDTPIGDAAWRDVTLAHLFRDLRVSVGLETVPVPARRKPRRGSETRLRILNGSALIQAVASNA